MVTGGTIMRRATVKLIKSETNILNLPIYKKV